MRWHSRHSTWPIVHRIADRLLGLVSVTSPPRFVSSASWVNMPSVLLVTLFAIWPCFENKTLRNCQVGSYSSVLVSLQQRTEMTDQCSAQTGKIYWASSKQYILQAWEWTNPWKSGPAQFGFPFLYPVVSSLEQVPMQNRGIVPAFVWLVMPRTNQGMGCVFLPEGLTLVCGILFFFFLVATSSDHHFGLCVPIPTT